MKIINNELDLITKCINDNRIAQKELYDLYKVRMFTLCQRYMSCKMDAEDILQEGWVKVFKQIRTFDPQRGNFYSWIKRIFINTNLEYLRKKRLQFEDIRDSEISYSTSLNKPIHDMSMQELVKLLQELPPGYRSVFNLYVLEGYSHKEIGETLNISINTSKTQFMKAKKMMQTKVHVLRAI
ncbi:MAG: RNA polymerase sigma factor (sigma-70 family) [Saprospiraceae bacterium]|jgi:RNA polymerase sigma factor (sigma-70 family)